MDKIVFRERYRALQDAWRKRDFQLAIQEANALLESRTNHPSCLRIRLKSAMQLRDVDRVAEFAPSVAGVDIELALVAADNLARKNASASAVEVYCAIIASPLLKTAPANLQNGARKSARNHVTVLAEHGDQAIAAGNVAEAVSLWRAGLRILPIHSGLRKRLKNQRDSFMAAARKVDRKNVGAYVAAWEEVLSADPTYPTALKNLAINHESRDDYEKAMSYWTTLTQIKDERERAVSRLMRAASKVDAEFQALTSLNAAGLLSLIESDVLNRAVRRLIHTSRVLLREGDPQSAAPILRLLRDMGISDEGLDVAAEKCAKLLFRAMWAARREDQWPAAAVLARHLISLAPNHLKALEVLGRYGIRQRAYSDAVGFLERLVESAPSDEKGWRLLANARHKSGDVDGSLAAHQRHLSLAAAHVE